MAGAIRATTTRLAALMAVIAVVPLAPMALISVDNMLLTVAKTPQLARTRQLDARTQSKPVKSRGFRKIAKVLALATMVACWAMACAMMAQHPRWTFHVLFGATIMETARSPTPETTARM